MINSLTLFEFESVFASSNISNEKYSLDSQMHPISVAFFNWLKNQCLGTDKNNSNIHWLKLRTKNGKEVIQFAGYVGVLRSPTGEQIEILPKTGIVCSDRADAIRKNRQTLISMLKALPNFRHFKSSEAELKTIELPLLEVFINQFLMSVQLIIKRGLKNDYLALQDNLYSLRGKLLVSQHIKHNIVRSDRFYTEHDEYSPNRPENRLIATALRKVLKYTRSSQNQKLARELAFVFYEIPNTQLPELDFKRVSIDRGMDYYEGALDWAYLILNNKSPLTGSGSNTSISLLFPMSALFEAYVAKSIAKTLKDKWQLKTQSSKYYLVNHKKQKWFQLKPDMLLSYKNKKNEVKSYYVLDTKWKLIDTLKTLNNKDKYGLSQSDFYQLYAYGRFYLNGMGTLVLIYPKTESFKEPLECFEFNDTESKLKLYVVPFDLEKNELVNTRFDDFEFTL